MLTTALAESDAVIAAIERRADAALQARITDEDFTISEGVQWCAGATRQREVFAS